MSNEKDVIILKKMVKYCNNSRKYAVGKTYEEFIEDERSLVFAVFSLSQAGELVTLLDKSILSKYTDIPWNALKSIRNRIVHDYEGVQYKIIWNIIQNEVEQLMIDLQNIITNIDKDKKC